MLTCARTASFSLCNGLLFDLGLYMDCSLLVCVLPLSLCVMGRSSIWDYIFLVFDRCTISSSSLCYGLLFNLGLYIINNNKK